MAIGAEDDQVRFLDPIHARSVVRHVVDGLLQICPVKLGDRKRGSFSEKAAELPQECGRKVGEALVRNIASINLAHALAKEFINLQGVGDNGITLRGGSAKSGDGRDEVALECLDHAANRGLLCLLLGFPLLISLLHVCFQMHVSEGIVPLCRKQE